MWPVSQIKRQLHERRAKYEAYTPEQQAAWRTANATVWIAIFTIVLACVGGITLYEVIAGGSDTHELAVQAKRQSAASVQQVGAMAALAMAAGEQATATNDLAKEAKRAADIAQAQQAPWIGIEQASVISAQPRYSWLPAPVPPDIPNPTIYVETGFSVKNYGGAPAFLEDETTWFDPVPERGGPSRSLRQVCQIDAYRTPGQVVRKGDIGEMILPGAIKVSGVAQNMTHDVRTTKALKRVWITICIVYQDRQTKWHYSGYRYITQSGDAAPVMFPDHPGWSFLPFTRAVLIAASAD
jgi:hypothetical protein